MPNPFLCRRPTFAASAASLFAALSSLDQLRKSQASDARTSTADFVLAGNYLKALRVLQDELIADHQADRGLLLVSLAEVELLLGLSDAAEMHYLEAHQWLCKAYGVDDALSCAAADGLVRLWSPVRNMAFNPGAGRAESVSRHVRLIAGTKFTPRSSSFSFSYADKAIEMARKSLLVRQKTFGNFHNETARAWFVLGMGLYQGANSGARSAFLRAEKILIAAGQSQNSSPVQLAELLYWLARSYLVEGAGQLAAETLARAIHLVRLELCDDHPFLCELYLELGLAHQRDSQFQLAEQAYKRALSINVSNFRQQCLPSYNENVFLSLRQVLIKQGNVEGVHKAFRDELQLVRDLPESDNLAVEKLRDLLSFFREHQMNHEIKGVAQQLATAAAKIQNRAAERESLCAYAAVLQSEGNLDAAEALFREAGFTDKNPGPLVGLFHERQRIRELLSGMESPLASQPGPDSSVGHNAVGPLSWIYRRDWETSSPKSGLHLLSTPTMAMENDLRNTNQPGSTF